MSSQSFSIIGVDIGGTYVRAMACYEDGNPAGPRYQESSLAKEGTELVIGRLAEIIARARDAAEVPALAIGLAMPGHIDSEHGIVRWAPNFGEIKDGIYYSWQNVSLKSPLEEIFKIPVFIGNDANLAALGEYRYGVGLDSARCLLMITLGTGIGSGVVMSSRAVQGTSEGPLILVGGNQGGMELGHLCIDPDGLAGGSGLYGTLENYCQRDSIVARAINKILKGRETILKDLTSNDYSKITPKILSEAAERGDEVACEVWEEVGKYLGIGIGNAINIFAPDVLAIGGQVSKAGSFLLHPAHKMARNIAIPTFFETTRIVLAQKVEDAGLLGAAAFAGQLIKSQA